MSNFWIDLIVSLTLLGGLFFVGRSIVQKKYSFGLFIVLLVGCILRLYLINDPVLHDWDERFHALVAKHLIDHPFEPTLFEHPVMPYDKMEWIATHLWLSKPPVPLWSMSASIATFGNNVFAVRLPSLIIGLIGVFVTFSLGKRLFNHKIGLIAAFLHSINGLVIELGAGRVSSDHVETFFIVFVEIAIFFVVLSVQDKKGLRWIALAGVFTALAFLSKWFPALLVFPIWLVAVIFSKHFSWKRFFIHGVVLVSLPLLLVTPWLIQVNAYGDDILFRLLFAFNETIQGHKHPIYYYGHQLMIIFGELFYAALAIGIILLSKGKDRSALWMLLIWIFIPLLVFTIGETKRHTYILIAAPACFMLIAYAIVYLQDHLQLFRQKWLAYLVIGLLIILPIRYSIERLKLFQNTPDLDPFYTHEEHWRGKFDERDVVFGLDRNIDLMFFTDVGAAYPYLPLKKEVAQLEEQGYRVYYYVKGEFIGSGRYFTSPVHQ